MHGTCCKDDFASPLQISHQLLGKAACEASRSLLLPLSRVALKLPQLLLLGLQLPAERRCRPSLRPRNTFQAAELLNVLLNTS